MTIALSANTPRVSYTVSQGATQTAFTVNFEFFDDADLNFYVDGTKKTLTTHYTVSGGNGSTGTINTTSGNSVTGASGGSTVVITRDIALARVTDFPSSGAFQVATLNTELDRFTAIASDISDETSRSIQLADEDSAVSMELPLLASRKGTVLGFNASTGAVEAGPTIANVNSLSAITTNIVTVAGISGNVTTVAGISANTTTVAGISGNVSTVAGIASNVTTVAGKASLITSDFASDMALIDSTFVSKINLVTSDFVTDMSVVTSDFIADLNALATTAIIADLDLLATSDFISDLNAVEGIKANVTTVAGIASNVTSVAGNSSNINSAVSNASNINSAVSNASNINSAVSNATNINSVVSNASNINTVAGAITNVNNVGGSITNVNTVATNLSGVNSFADRYRVASSAPSSSLDVGDLYFDTTANELKVYKSSGWAAAGSTVNGTSARFHYDIGSAVTSVTGSDANGNTLAYDAGFIDVYVNGVRMSTADVTITSGDTVTFASALASGDEVDIVAFGTFAVANIVSTGALNSGSITSGFGNIDTGSSTITTTGVGTFGSLDISGDIDVDGTTNLDVVDIDGAVDMASTLSVTGNVLVNTTDTSPWNNTSATGILLSSGGVIASAVSGDASLYANRLGSDGDIIQLRKGGTTIGSIGSEGGDSLYILSGDTGLKFSGGGDVIIPVSTTGSARDNAIDLGSSGARFNNLYLSGGVFLGGTGPGNKIDDYEEGSFSPNGNWTSGSAGYYVKVGSVVHISLDVVADSTGGTASITNLPFSCNTTVGSGIYTNNVTYASGRTAPTVVIAGNSAIFRVVGSGVSFSSMPITANGSVSASFTYRTTS